MFDHENNVYHTCIVYIYIYNYYILGVVQNVVYIIMSIFWTPGWREHCAPFPGRTGPAVVLGSKPQLHRPPCSGHGGVGGSLGGMETEQVLGPANAEPGPQTFQTGRFKKS